MQLHTYVALLRGINVGGNSLVSMDKLRACFERLGYHDVTTYINSGNVIFRTPPTNPRKLEERIETALDKELSLPVRVVVRSLDEMTQLIRNIPKSWTDAAGLKCNVIFLRHTIDNTELLKNFNPKPDIEELHYHPGVLFWSAKTSDLTRSNMIKVNTLPIYKEMTVRILNSVRKIYDLMKQIDKLPAK